MNVDFCYEDVQYLNPEDGIYRRHDSFPATPLDQLGAARHPASRQTRITKGGPRCQGSAGAYLLTI